MNNEQTCIAVDDMLRRSGRITSTKQDFENQIESYFNSMSETDYQLAQSEAISYDTKRVNEYLKNPMKSLESKIVEHPASEEFKKKVAKEQPSYNKDVIKTAAILGAVPVAYATIYKIAELVSQYF